MQIHIPLIFSHLATQAPIPTAGIRTSLHCFSFSPQSVQRAPASHAKHDAVKQNTCFHRNFLPADILLSQKSLLRVDRKRPDMAGPLERFLGESPLLPACYLQYIIDEWCSPYSSWLRTMKGCSCRTPTDSVLLAGILVEVSAWSACGSEHGSGSDVLISAFFSAL